MLQTTMKAVRVREFGGPDTLRYDEVPVPEPARDEVLIQVRAVGLNPPDWYTREGMPDVPRELLPPIPLPIILGTDASGVVVSTGEDVTRFTAGDEVFGMLRFPAQLQAGTYAQYVTAPATDLARTPNTVGHRVAAAAAMSALTAWQFLIDLGHDHPSPFQSYPHRPVPLGPGTKVLINGAAGGVGHLAVQLAKWKGAEVTAVASAPHEDFLHRLGVDEFIDYTSHRPEDVVRDMDLVLDTVGGPGSGRFLRVLRHGGALFPVYLASYEEDEVARRAITTSATQVRSSGRQLEQIATLLDAGALRVAIDSEYSLADAHHAHTRAARGHIQGKIVLTVDGR